MELGLRRHDSAALQSTPQTPADCPAGDPHAAPAAARPILPRLVQTGEEIFRVDGICFSANTYCFGGHKLPVYFIPDADSFESWYYTM
jgi:hypothetical protein